MPTAVTCSASAQAFFSGVSSWEDGQRVVLGQRGRSQVALPQHSDESRRDVGYILSDLKAALRNSDISSCLSFARFSM